MISWLQGSLKTVHPSGLVSLNVQGVGYEVMISANTLSKLPKLGSTLELFIHLVVREDSHTLFGFYTEHDRDIFRKLIKVNGVGPRLALAVLSVFSGKDLIQVVLSNDVSSLIKVPGIGKKVAERLILELHSRVKSLSEHTFNPFLATQNPANTSTAEAIAALVQLGYKASQAEQAVLTLSTQDPPPSKTEDLVRLALQQLGRV